MKKIGRHGVFWCLYILFTVGIYYVQEPNLGLHITYELASLPAKFLTVYATLYFILPQFLLKKKYGLAFLQFAILLIVGMFFLRLLVWATVYPIYFADLDTKLIPSNPTKLISPLLDLIIVSSIAVVIKLLRDREKQQLDHLNRAKSNIQNELQLLKSQLHPHFLFNTLNGLYAQILENPEKASNMVVQLSDLLRFILYEAKESLVSVKEDLECLGNYMALEQIRYGDRLDLKHTILGNTVNKKIAPLLLLPFIENSFKHGISKDYEKCWIRCEIELFDDILMLALENSKPSFFEEDRTEKGIGLKNVKQRLEHLYPQKYDLTITESEDRFFVHLKIPLENK
ncbi:sensor histidine kinase [Ulvibacterium marinum]|uniref:sensor histidine kinase n=1 Tax=Ulvibacterium marinum TaxID=2419782 RepID=UPI002494F15C|nr:histidine kinase [Ulvibacterium marinum]